MWAIKQREFKEYNCDLSSLQESIELYFVWKGLRVTNFRMGDVYLTQVYKKDMPDKISISELQAVRWTSKSW